MDKTLLQQLYDGEVYPAECINPRSQEYLKINRAISEEKHYFYGVLSEEHRKHFDEIDDLWYQANSVYGYENFVYGLRLGVRLMIEISDDVGALKY